jgi:1-acyl-sn-glycerol-3-phosphate acyltransferase
VPIVPIAVTSARCWPRKSFLLRPGRDRHLDRQAHPVQAASPTS